ncbi:MAG: hypothetical protein K0R55_971 [Sporomusa sp.]|jgi:pyruvate/2-oxoacid:ferredoxin oxidoreductase alpha subunit|nr:hypothetical protein [Sporomusa sp.]
MNMPFVYDVLSEELDRLKIKEKIYAEKISSLPKGSLVRKKINGSIYHYRVYREGRQIKTQYIKSAEVEVISRQIIQRRSI